MARTTGARAALAAAALLVLGLIASCSAPTVEPQPTARPVTTEEAQLLAIARFNNFDAGSRPFVTDVTEQGSDLQLQGWVDYVSQLGYAAVTGSFEPQVLLWDSSTVGIHPGQADASGDPALPIPPLAGEGWVSHPIDPSTSRLDALVAAISALGSDRPDNPLLVQQAGAYWLGEREIDGTPMTVFAAPPSDQPLDASSPPVTADTSPLRLWVDGQGMIRRAEMLLGGTWTTVDFAETDAPALSLPDEEPQ